MVTEYFRWEIAYIETPFGKIKVKQALKKGKIIREIPEYEDVKKAALKHDVPSTMSIMRL